MKNIVYIATSIDGYIADRNGGLDWLEMIPNPEGDDLGWGNFMASIDAIIMGRKTFDKVCSFDCDWPYPKPVFVLSNSLKEIDRKYVGKVEVISGTLTKICQQLENKGFSNLYIDGGVTIQCFLEADLIDEMIIHTLPILLGGGTPLFGSLTKLKKFSLISAETQLNQIVRSHYKKTN